MMDQVTAVFGLFMTFFYAGVGAYLLISRDLYYIDKYLRNIVGGAFILFGIYRGFRTVVKLRDLYFSGREENDDRKYGIK